MFSVPSVGYFDIGTVTVEDWFHRLWLVKLKTPEIVNGKRCGFALKFYKCYKDKPPVLLWQEDLPTTRLLIAQKSYAKKVEEIEAKKAAKEKQVAESIARAHPNFTQSQFMVLSKAFPETVAFLTNQKRGSAKAIYAAYQRETFALTGNLLGTLNKTEFTKTATALRNAARRKHLPWNPVEFQLVAGWRLRGYDRMTPQQRYDALKSLRLDPVSPDAIRKTCERLKLPPGRKRGAPRKTTVNK